MANRYWVGGTASWDATAGTKWAATSGGTSGASAPGLSDDVFFDNNSGTGTVTIAAGNGGAKSITCTGFAGTLAGSTALTIAGGFVLNATMGFTYSGTITFTGTGTLITASRSLGSIIISAPSGTISLGSDLLVTNPSTASITLTQGTFNTGIYNVTAGSFSSNNSNVRTLTLGSGIFIVTNVGGGNPFDIATKTNLIVNAGPTSTLRIQGSTAGSTVTIDLGWFTWGKVVLQTTTTNITLNGSCYIDDLTTNWQAATGRTITFTGGTTTTIRSLNVNGSASGSTSLVGTVGTTNLAILERPASAAFVNASGLTAVCAPLYLGTSATVTSCTKIFALAYVAPFTHYWVGGTGTWTNTANWSTSSGGAGGSAVPYGDEDVVFDSASSSVGYTLTFNGGFNGNACKNFTASQPASGALTLAAGDTGVTLYGSISIGATNINVSGYTNPAIWFNASSTISINLGALGNVTTPATASNLPLYFTGINGIFNLAANVDMSYSGEATSFVSHTAGTFNTNNYTFLVQNTGTVFAGFSSTGNIPRTLNFGSSLVGPGSIFTGGQAGSFVLSGTNLTFNPGTSTVVAYTINGGGRAFYGVGNYKGNLLSLTAGDSYQYIVGQGSSAAGISTININVDNITLVGIQTVGTDGTRRVIIASNTLGISRTINVTGASSLTDVDFRDIIIQGVGAPLSGTRVADLGGCKNIIASVPKTVYWATAAGGNWLANNWAASPGGAVSTDNFPLAQDTATFVNTGLNTSATIQMNGPVIGSVDMSGRTNAMTLSFNSFAITSYGDWKNGSGTTISNTQSLIFAKRGVQTITCAGKTFTPPIIINSFTGTVELADAFSAANGLTVTSGTFDAKTYNVTPVAISSSNANVRTIRLGAATTTLSSATPFTFTDKTNLTFNAGTSQVNLTATTATALSGNGLTFYNVSFTGTTAAIHTVNGANTFNNLLFTAPATTGYMQAVFSANQTVSGTLTCAGATAIRRVVLRSDTAGTSRTLTVGTLSATDCDFQDITIAGTAAGTTPTRAGDRGGNSGITFTSKTVYWNLAGTQNWSATGWAATSGGSPNINNLPLPQDTAVFDNAGSAGIVDFDVALVVGTIDASARTTAMILRNPDGLNFVSLFGNYKLGTGVTTASTFSRGISFVGRSTQTITSNGVQSLWPITITKLSGIAELQDELSIGAAYTLLVSGGTFNAITYNVTAGLFSAGAGTTIKMGTGTWTLSGTGNVWSGAMTNLNVGTANIVLSDTSTTVRTFAGGGFSYNKLTIGGTTGISTTTITGNNFFLELASTKTVAHTIALGATTPTFGKWSVTGTVGNVVTVTGTASLTIAGAATSGLDYLAMGTTSRSTTSPGEFYAGANSTGTGANITLTAPPAGSTRYWVGGTGNWGDTAKWSTLSGGAGGASVPTSLDDAIFNSASNATAYTATVNVVARCKQLTIAGPASGNVTLAGSSALICHDNVIFPATGMTNSYTGSLTLSGSTTGKTLISNGVGFTAGIGGSPVVVNGFGCEWSLGSALSLGNFPILNVIIGTINFATYNVSATCLFSSYLTPRGIKFGSGTHTFSNASLGVSPFTAIEFGTTETQSNTLTIDGGTSQINLPGDAATRFLAVNLNSKTVYNMNFATGDGSLTINGSNTFNNLSSNASTLTDGQRKIISFAGNQVINGTFTLTGGTNATRRQLIVSNTVGTPRTLTVAAFNGTDVDFRDIVVEGAAAPISGTRIGNCKGNLGITFTAAANKYWNLAAGGSVLSTAWALTSGGTPAANNFPLPQDTCIFENTGLNTGAGVSLCVANTVGFLGTFLGTINAAARTNAMTLAPGTVQVAPTILGDWILGTGVTLSTQGFALAGRTTQNITSAGVSYPVGITIDSIGGSVVLQDAFTSAGGITLTNGTFNASIYNVTLTGSFASSNSNTRTVAIGSGTWTIASASGWNAATSTGLTVTGTGTISLTSASAKTFAGGSINYGSVVVNQGGVGTLTITGNNTFSNITNTYKTTGATTINFGTTTQRVAQWTAAGEAGRLLTIQGTSTASPATIIYTGNEVVNTDYLAITGIRVFPATNTWYAGTNSINSGSLGWNFSTFTITYNFFNFF